MQPFSCEQTKLSQVCSAKHSGAIYPGIAIFAYGEGLHSESTWGEQFSTKQSLVVGSHSMNEKIKKFLSTLYS